MLPFFLYMSRRESSMKITRREFLQGAAVGSLLAGSSSAAVFQPAKSRTALPTRLLGNTGENVTMLGLGGARFQTSKDALDVVAKAYDCGVTYFDTAHGYSLRPAPEGDSEYHYGRALKGKRNNIFLATKTAKRTAQDAEKEFLQSLKHLQTDYIDLYQVHGIQTTDELETLFGPQGAMEFILKEQEKGAIRYIGITGHRDPYVHLEALNHFPFDTMLIPLNILDPHYLSFEKIVLPELVKRNTGVIAMKVTVAGRLLDKKVASVQDCLRYTWSLPVSTAILGCKNVQEFDIDFQEALNFQPVTKAEINVLLAATEPYKGTGLEVYKKKI